MMISPRKIITNNDDEYLKAIAKIIKIDTDKLFFKLEAIKDTGEINGFTVTKNKDDDDGTFSYLIQNNNKEEQEQTMRIVCTF